MSIGNKIKSLRKERHLTQKKLAEKANIPVITLQQYEREVRKQPKIEILMRIADALDTSISFLLGDTDNPDDKSFRVTTVDLAWNEVIERQKDIEKQIKSAEDNHLKVLREICTVDTNYNAATPLYNLEFMPIRINMVTEFLDANKDFLQKNMPGHKSTP